MGQTTADPHSGENASKGRNDDGVVRSHSWRVGSLTGAGRSSMFMQSAPSPATEGTIKQVPIKRTVARRYVGLSPRALQLGGASSGTDKVHTRKRKDGESRSQAPPSGGAVQLATANRHGGDLGLYMGQFEVSDAAVNLAMMNLRDESPGDTSHILKAHEEEVEKVKIALVEECNRQYEDLALKAEPLGFDLGPSLALWTLPSEILGATDTVGTDKESLQKALAACKAELKAAKERIAYLEGATSVSKASRQIRELRNQMAEKKARGGKPVPDGSKACIIS